MNDQNPHIKHRSRMRETIRKKGVDDLPDHEILEYLLFYAIPRKDVNVLAHNLISQFGSLSGVLDAGFEQLFREQGIGESAASFLSSLPGIFRAYRKDRIAIGTTFACVEDVDEYLNSQFFGRSVETLIMVCISSSNRLLSTQVLAEGCVDSVPLPVRMIARHALIVADTKRIAIGHNHPRGFLYPSDADVTSTRELQKTLKSLGIDLVDHIVAGDDDYVSLRNSNLLLNINEIY